MIRKKVTNTTTTMHPLRNECEARKHSGYKVLTSQWGTHPTYKAFRCSNCEATWTEQK